MSEDLREKAAWVAGRLTIVADRYEKHGQWTNGTNHDAMMIVKELRQAASLLALLPTEGEPVEPVAFMVKWGTYTELFTRHNHAKRVYDHWKRQPDNKPVSLTPLFATPQESAEPGDSVAYRTSLLKRARESEAEVEDLRGSLEEWKLDFKAMEAEVERLREAMSYVRNKLAGRGAKFTKAWDGLMQECVEHLDRAALNTETDG